MALVSPTFHFKIRKLEIKILNPLSARYALLTLIAAALLSAAIYAWALTKPIGLIEYQNWPLLDLYHYAHQIDPAILLKLIVAFIALGGLYWLGWRAALRAQDRRAWLIVIGGAVVFGAVLLFMFPYDAADFFDNILHGRLSSVYAVNPFQAVIAQYRDDPFYLYTAWRSTPSAYGPLWESLAGLTARLAGDDFMANVIVFKLMLSAFWIGCVVLVALIVRRLAPKRVLAAVVLFAWNPIGLYETIGQGHNDITLVFWMLLAAGLLIKKHYTLSITALIAGALFKYIPLLLIPAALLIAWRDLPTLRARLRFLTVTLLVCAGLIVATYAPFWRGIETLGIERRAHLFTTSLPAVAYVSLSPLLGEETAGNLISVIAIGLTAIFALAQSWRAWRDRTDLSFARSAFYILMFYLLITCLWFQQWYAVWPLGFAALLSPGRAARLGALFSYIAQTKPLIFSPPFLWVRPLPPSIMIDTWFGPLVMSIAWAYAAWAILITIRQKRTRKESPWMR